LLTWAVWILQINRHFKRVYFGGVVALWDPDQALVLVQVNTTLEKIPAWQIVAAKLFGLAQFRHERFTKRDILVFKLHGSSFYEYQQSNVNLAGNVRVVDGTAYLISGGRELVGFRWDGTRFLNLSPEAAKSILAMGDDPHWHKLDWEELGHIGPGYDKEFSLRGFAVDAKLRIAMKPAELQQHRRAEHGNSVKLDLTLNGETKILLHTNQEYSAISAAEFQAVLHRK
jgi:hypothetical protein